MVRTEFHISVVQEVTCICFLSVFSKVQPLLFQIGADIYSDQQFQELEDQKRPEGL